MLLGQDTRRKRLRGVTRLYRDRRLGHDGTVVKGLVYEVDGAAADAHSVVKCLMLGVQARKRRQERGVDVQNPLRKRPDERRA